MSLLSTLQDRFLGGLRGDRAALDETRSKLNAELATIEARRRELGEAIESAESEADRETIERGKAAAAEALAAAQRERQRLDLAREKNRAAAADDARGRLVALMGDEEEARDRLDQIAASFVDFERQGRALWAEATDLLTKAPRIARSIEATRAELEALGERDLPEPTGTPSETYLINKVNEGARAAARDKPLRALRGPYLLGYLFDRLRP